MKDSSYLPAYEDGYLCMKMEQTVFRNVGIYNSDAGELPRRKRTTIYMLLKKHALSLFTVHKAHAKVVSIHMSLV
jgi:predicted cupin superfamily sugar epimerase